MLHPDLEQDPSLRERKTGLMQEVTAAHAGGDLHTLLRLELEWIDGDGPAAARRTETLDAAGCRDRGAHLRSRAAVGRAGRDARST
ncbi:MAG: hypothetical protein M3541_03900 [Acidobacteriota bacterium]|nr:hypothetical protein [Acidobacteriota bacterium]